MTYFAPLVTTDSDGQIRVEVPFHRAWLSAIRYVVPHGSKRQGQEGNVWRFSPQYTDIVVQITLHFFPQTKVILDKGSDDWANQDLQAHDRWWRWRERGDVRAREPAKVSPREVLCVTSAAPVEVVRAAYRALTKLHHPDVGGDAEEFKRVQAAWEMLRAEEH